MFVFWASEMHVPTVEGGGEKPDRDSPCLSDELYHIHMLWMIPGKFMEHFLGTHK